MSDAPIAIAAGGTGGHFFPAEALAGALLRRGRRVVLLTDRRSGGQDSAVFAGSPIHVLRGAGVFGRGVARAARAAAALGAGTLQARAVLKHARPAAVVAFGGYPSVAPVLGSRMLRRRPSVILHEQNAVLGRANRRLCRHADLLALSFQATERVPGQTRTELTGNPVRPAIEQAANSLYAPPAAEAVVNLVVLGGSLGARVLSEVVPAALGMLPVALRARLRLTQQCREEDLPAVCAAYETAGIAARLESFFTDVAGLMRDAHLVVARAGASTVAELALIGRPAILVPLPGAIDDHQAANATALGEGAWMMRQGVFSAESLSVLIAHLMDEPALLAAAAVRMAAHGRRHAAERLADLVDRATAKVSP